MACLSIFVLDFLSEDVEVHRLRRRIFWGLLGRILVSLSFVSKPFSSSCCFSLKHVN